MPSLIDDAAFAIEQANSDRIFASAVPHTFRIHEPGLIEVRVSTLADWMVMYPECRPYHGAAVRLDAFGLVVHLTPVRPEHAANPDTELSIDE